MLGRFWILLGEIKELMTSKGKHVSFASDDDWLNDLAFLVDITKHLSDLNVKLQGKDQLIHKMYEHMLTQIQILNLFQTQLLEGNCAHFVTLATRPTESVHHEKYAGLVERLKDEFLRGFEDCRDHVEMKIFADPFGIDFTTIPPKYQLELIALQNDNDMKRAFREQDIISFYRNYVPIETFHNLRECALHFVSMFGSKSCCEQLFPRMKNVKTKSRSRLSDGHSAGTLRIGTSRVGADIDFFM